MEKIKVVWICHFSNKEVKSNLPLFDFSLKNRIKKILGKKNPSIHVDFAPWISTLIKEFERFDDVELHVIAPHMGLKRITFEFEINRVHFHFFRPYVFLHVEQIIDRIFKPKKKYRLNRFLVHQYLKKYKPDIVNLFGAENPYYSITALDIQEIPVYVLLQTVLSAPFNNELNYSIDNARLVIENRVFSSLKYFGTTSRMYHDSVINANPNAEFLEFWFPTENPPSIEEQIIEFDFVFFASGLSQSKGVEDAIEAIAIVNKTLKNARLNIIGYCSAEYKEFLENKVSTLGLNWNIIFSSYFTLHADMFRQVKKAKIALLPHKIDVVSSTIREAMFLGLPIVTYKTTGTPYLNSEMQTVLISDIGDIEGLAKNMIMLLNSPELAQNLVENAKSIARKLFDNTVIAKKLIEQNKAIVNHYRHNTPIPEHLLFKPEEYPNY